MKTKKRKRGLSVLLAVLAAAACLLTGCGAQKSEAQEDAETIQVYLWNTTLYENYAPYIQSQLPDVNIEFIVGNNDLDFYKFPNENGGLPDIITCCRFSLHDAAPLKDSLMNLATTNEAGAVYNTYLSSFKNADGSVNWLPVCADAHGFLVNRGLFAKYGIPLPTDYDSTASAALMRTIPTITPAWKPFRDFRFPSFPRRKAANGAPRTATRPIPRKSVWTTPSGRPHSRTSRTSSAIPA